MRKNHRVWSVPVSGTLLLATAVSAEQDLQTYLDSTNRVTLSLRFGLNISGKFKGTGGILGNAGHYVDGYVLTDVSGNAGNQTWYWGYQDAATQLNKYNANSIDMHRYSAAGLTGDTSGDDSPYIGAELAYNYELGIKEDWHHLRYGLEVAVNFMPIEFNSGGLYSAVSRITDTYGYTAGTTPPAAPYSGGYQGPNFVLNVPPINSSATPVSGATFLAQQHFDANLWGFRLGPYIEYPLDKKWSLHLSGGLAVGLLDAEANWKEKLTDPVNSLTLTASGSGTDTSLLWGYYIGLEAAYQINKDWGIEAGVQFQDLGTYSHNFGGRVAELDLSQSIFVHVGISYSF